MSARLAHKTYQGTIGYWNIRNHNPYRGTITSRNLKHGKLYQGTLNRTKFKPNDLGNLPDRANPYRYYNLPPDYYGVRRPRTKVRSLSHVQSKRKIHSSEFEDTPKISHRSENNNVALEPRIRTPDKQNTYMPKPAIKRDEKQLIKEPPVHRNTTPAAISTFPTPSPEVPTPPLRKNNINSKSYHSQIFNDSTKYEPIFPPIIPVTLEDFIKPEPPSPPQPVRPRRNPLIPVVVPDFVPTRSHLISYNKNPMASSMMPLGNYKDSLSRSFTNVPGYSAVGAMLRSMHIN